jgi:hypothetical protein
MFARGVAYLHAAHLPVPKGLAAKSRVSISSKLIETKGLQVLHFGHLRKTGGRGSYWLVHATHHPVRKSLAAQSNYSGHSTKDVRTEHSGTCEQQVFGLFERGEGRFTRNRGETL